jgi:hypothetical protein
MIPIKTELAANPEVTKTPMCDHPEPTKWLLLVLPHEAKLERLSQTSERVCPVGSNPTEASTY